MTYDAPASYYGAQPEPRRRGSGMAIAALVLGILALLTCWTVIGGILLGVVAIVIGIIALRRVKRGEAEGRPMAIIGIVTGALGLALAVGLVALSISFFNSDTGSNLRDCLEKAGNDQAAQTECQREFQDDLAS